MGSLPTLDYVEHIAKTAGLTINEMLNSHDDLQIAFKGSPRDLITKVDLAVEKQLKQQIITDFPHSKFFCEESEKCEFTADLIWIIDPIDGTTNFVYQTPLYCISIGVMFNYEIILGVVYVPCLNELYAAAVGKGATRNGIPIHVSGQSMLDRTLIGVGFNTPMIYAKPTDTDYQRSIRKKLCAIVMENTAVLVESCRDLRAYGACAIELCFVACGRYDAFAQIGNYEWDLAAGVLILKEAGGSVVNFQSTSFSISAGNVVAAGSTSLAEKLSSLLKSIELPELREIQRAC